MTILITGSAGFIGSCLIHYILSEKSNVSVVGIDNLSGGYMTNMPIEFDRFHFCEMNTEDDRLADIFERYTPDIVYHMSAYAAEGLSPFMRKYTVNSNMMATANIINCCINYNVKRLVYTSSMSVYGDGIEGERFDEDLTPHPLDPYAISKYACELDIQSASRTHGLEYCIIRPHNVYGIRQNIWDTYRNVLAIWMMQYLNSEPLTIYGTGEQTRAFSNIDDMLEPLWKAGVSNKARNQIINLGGMHGIAIKDACMTMCKVLDPTGTVSYEYKEPRYEVRHAVPTYEKSVELLGYHENISMEEGLKTMWRWVKGQPKRERFHWDKYEVEKGIYSYWK